MGKYKDCYGVHQTVNGTKSIYRVITPWKESSVTYKFPWNSNGGDYDSSAIDQNTNSTIKVWENFDVTSTIKSFQSDTFSNYGFLIKFNSYNPAKSVNYISSENPDTNKRPKLVIEYYEDKGEPPSSIKPDLFTIPFAEKYSVNVINIQGRNVASFETKNLNRMDTFIKSLSSGVHILHITAPHGKFSRQIKVVR